jgi:acetyl-CoA carboxylase biotin carboxyl carrier protein
MDGNRHYSYNTESKSREEDDSGEAISIEQLRHLVRLLDKSDISEIEVKRTEEGTRLVLRKASTSEGSDLQILAAPAAAPEAPAPAETKHTVTAPLVGIFHTWAKPRGKPLVAVGDHVKVGQLLGTIQSLNVINEVESLVAGRVAEILIQDGQAVEYGQQLMIIDSSEEG